MTTLSTEYPIILSNILEYTHNYLDENPGIKGFVMGLSGGIDSAVTAALANIVASDRPGFKVIGRALPIITNAVDETARGVDVGKALCTDFDELIGDRLFNGVYMGLRGVPPIAVAGKITKAEKIQRGNMKARIRMLILYDLAHREDSIVLSTDNLTELLLGFWTLHGDVGDFGMIQSLFKTEVYGLSAYLARKFEGDMNRDAADAIRKCAGAVPTDGLGVSNSDLDQILPRWSERCNGDPIHGYEVVDKMLIDYLNEGKGAAGSVVRRHLATEFKRENPINIPRDVLLNKEPL
jgi:NAD+ synthase